MGALKQAQASQIPIYALLRVHCFEFFHVLLTSSSTRQQNPGWKGGL